MLAGLSGFLMAAKNGGVNPEFLSWHDSGAVLLMIILGGLGSLRGAVQGTVAFVLLKEFFLFRRLAGPGRRPLANDARAVHDIPGDICRTA
jgi:branched-chain amino acid transport system permease protein